MILANFLSPSFFWQGRCVLMPRYLRPLAPPPTILNKQEPGQQQAEAVAWSVLKTHSTVLDGLNQRCFLRFVSLVPHTATNAYFPGLGDVWPTSEQFLRMMVMQFTTLSCCCLCSVHSLRKCSSPRWTPRQSTPSCSPTT